MRSPSPILTPSSPTIADLYEQERIIEIEQTLIEHTELEWILMSKEREEREEVTGQCELFIPDVLCAFKEMGADASEIMHERVRLLSEPAYWHFWCAEGAWLGRIE